MLLQTEQLRLKQIIIVPVLLVSTLQMHLTYMLDHAAYMVSGKTTNDSNLFNLKPTKLNTNDFQKV
jgi:hypothetical protein